MTNIDRAEAILTARHHKDQMEGDGAVGCFDAAAAVEELHAAGLLAPEPKIIRTTDELTALDPETVVIGEELIVFTAADCVENNGFPLYDNDRLVVVATGDTVRAARQALEAGE